MYLIGLLGDPVRPKMIQEPLDGAQDISVDQQDSERF